MLATMFLRARVLAVLLVGVVGVAHADDTPRAEPDWFDDYDEAITQAREVDRLVLLEFTTPGCGWCVRQKNETWADPDVQDELRRFVRLRLSDDSEDGRWLAQRFGVQRFPTLVFLDGRGKGEDKVAGFIPPAPFLSEARRIRGGTDTISDLERRVLADKTDLELRYTLANKFWHLGSDAGFQAHMGFIERADPESKSLTRRRLALREMQEYTYGCYRRDGEFEPEHMLSFLAEEQYPELRYKGWAYLGAVYEEVGDKTAAREAWLEAADHAVTPGQIIETRNASAMALWNERDVLGTREAARALQLAEEALQTLDGMAGDNPRGRAMLLDTFARCSEWSGDEAAALAAWREAVALDPSEPLYASELAARGDDVGG